MAIVMIQDFEVEEDDLGTTNYDSVSERLGAKDDPPAGLIVHTAGFTGKGRFRVAEVWESEEALPRRAFGRGPEALDGGSRWIAAERRVHLRAT